METLISSKVTLQTDGYTNVHTVIKCVLCQGGGGGGVNAFNKLLYMPVRLAHISSLSISACLKVYRAKVGKD